MPGSHHTAAQPRLQIVPTQPPTADDLIGMAWDDYLAALETEETLWRDEQAARGLKAMRLAPTLAICRALLKGQPVPAAALDQPWRRRYGL